MFLVLLKILKTHQSF